MLNIRAAQSADVKTLLTLFGELAEFEKLSADMQVDEKRLRESLFGARKAAEALIVEFENEPVGYAVYFFNFSTFVGKAGLYLEDLYVRPGLRGRGIGEAVLKHIAAVAVDRGCERMEWVVLDWNTKAMDFYKRLGARPLSDWTIFRLGIDEIKSLAESH